MSLLITGGAGFIGLNFINMMIQKEYMIVNLDALTYAANTKEVERLEQYSNYSFVQGNICDLELLNIIFEKYNIKNIIHFAAESHVDNSIANPQKFIETNIVGTFQLLETARRHWMEGPFRVKKGYEVSRFLHVSTDEVYGSLEEDDPIFTEETRYSPNSPYSSSKASSDLLVRSYHFTYGMNTLITNCSNNFGPFQHDEKLIPTVIRSALSHSEIPVYGEGKNIRDWLYVEDHCNALNIIFNNAKSGANYNIGGNNEKSNIEIVTMICDILDRIVPSNRISSYKELITFVQDRPGHDKRYAINSTKLKNELGWEPSQNFEKNLEKTIRWYIKKYGYIF
ncbi:dTDP-glucose 4,6-dehydratase [Robertmurraya siralis]|uniref:dTDP-glucose 4,6-dehydratase n=1 Tax=Robertmurraya siralis TaxID=77777 RepID=A0A920BW14_9BACI|nr:dTDP-glucose 4,6-dehydratase [Robertmurraya siralis]GIN64056.1 dTDP-glucose 4,6-dehydratase [Robertmurraya siralis]